MRLYLPVWRGRRGPHSSIFRVRIATADSKVTLLLDPLVMRQLTPGLLPGVVCFWWIVGEDESYFAWRAIFIGGLQCNASYPKMIGGVL